MPPPNPNQGVCYTSTQRGSLPSTFSVPLAQWKSRCMVLWPWPLKGRAQHTLRHHRERSKVWSALADTRHPLRRMTWYSMKAGPRMGGMEMDPFHASNSIYWISMTTHPSVSCIRWSQTGFLLSGISQSARDRHNCSSVCKALTGHLYSYEPGDSPFPCLLPCLFGRKWHLEPALEGWRSPPETGKWMQRNKSCKGKKCRVHCDYRARDKPRIVLGLAMMSRL